MVRHPAIMTELLKSRAGRVLNCRVNQLLPAAVIAELNERKVNSHGTEASLRERLLRAILRAEHPDLNVPWYSHDEEGAGALEEIIGANVENLKPQNESERRQERPQRKRTPLQQIQNDVRQSPMFSKDRSVEGGRSQTVEAMVHQ